MYQLEIRIKTHLANQFSEGLVRFLDAHQKHEKGHKNIEIYTTYVGDGEVAFIRIPIHSLGELDNWVQNPQIVIDQLGDQEGHSALTRWAESFEWWSSRILRLSKDGY